MTMNDEARDRLPLTCSAADTTLWFAAVDSTNTVARRLLGEGIWPAATPVDASGSGDVSPDGVDAASDDDDAAHDGAASMPDDGQDGAAAFRSAIAVVAADEQTAGRGRLGRRWVSRPGESSMVSYATVLPAVVAADPEVNGWLQMIAGLATLDALRETCRGIGAAPLHDDPACGLTLKWPNDVFCHDHKLGGILCELVIPPGGADGPMAGLVFGVGINLGIPADRLPTELSTSLQLHRGPLPDPATMRDMIAARTASALRARLAAFTADPRGAARRLHDETRSVCWTLGRRVEARLTDGTTIRGEAVSLNADASLTVLADDGKTHTVHTGDVGVL